MSAGFAHPSRFLRKTQNKCAGPPYGLHCQLLYSRALHTCLLIDNHRVSG